jgi:predicted PhzF superfamily epimerase YddE/YHI9
VSEGDEYHIRWFTPVAEVDLCGHATLAAGHVIMNILKGGKSRVEFTSRSGKLAVEKRKDLLVLNFPGKPPRSCIPPAELAEGLVSRPIEVFCADDYLAVFESEKEILELKPRQEVLARLDLRGVIVTAPGDRADFVSRFFAPKFGIPEDPVTGSAHSTLIPYWSKRLHKKELYAIQVSKRRGELFCSDLDGRVEIGGRAAVFLEGIINI